MWRRAYCILHLRRYETRKNCLNPHRVRSDAHVYFFVGLLYMIHLFNGTVSVFVLSSLDMNKFRERSLQWYRRQCPMGSTSLKIHEEDLANEYLLWLKL